MQNMNFFSRKENILIIVIMMVFAISLIVLPINFIFIELAILLSYFLLRDYIWIMVILAPVVLTFNFQLPLSISSGWIYNMTLAEFFLALALLFFLVDLFLKRRRIFDIDQVLIFLSAYFLVALMSFFYIHDTTLFISGLKVIFFSVVAYFLSVNLLDNAKKINLFFLSLAVTAVIISVQIFYNFYSSGFNTHFFLERSSILIPVGAIAFASAILVLIIPTLISYYFTCQQYFCKIFINIAIMSSLLALFMSLGKGALISLFIGAGYLFLKLKSKRKNFVLVAIVLILFFAVGFSVYFEGLLIRLSHTFVDDNTRFRLLEYKVAGNIIKDHVLLGVGSGQQLTYYSRFLFPGYNQLANNMFLQSVLDLGFLGLAILSMIIISVAKKIKQALRQSNKNYVILCGIGASALAAFFNGLVEVTFFGLAYAIIFWLIIGMVPNLAKQ